MRHVCGGGSGHRRCRWYSGSDMGTIRVASRLAICGKLFTPGLAAYLDNTMQRVVKFSSPISTPRLKTSSNNASQNIIYSFISTSAPGLRSRFFPWRKCHILCTCCLGSLLSSPPLTLSFQTKGRQKVQRAICRLRWSTRVSISDRHLWYYRRCHQWGCILIPVLT